MIANQIKEMKILALRPKEEIDIKIIFQTILANFTANKKIIDACLKLETGMVFDLNAVKNIFIENKSNNYGNVGAPYIGEFGRVSENLVPYGIIGLVVNKKITLLNYLEIVKVCLETRNSLIIKPFTQCNALNLIIDIINDVLSQTPDFNNIVVTNENLENQNLDLLLYCGIKEQFNKLNTSCEKIFIGVGQYELYVDEVLDQNLIDFALNNGIKVYYNQENAIDAINSQGANYCTAIMSSNKEKIREFISNIKSSYVLVNMSPMLIKSVNLYPEQLLKRKTTVIYQ